MSLTRNAKEYRSTTVQQVSQNQPKQSLRRFSVLHLPNHLLLVGVDNRNIIITQLFHAAPTNQNFLWYTDCIFQL